MSTVRMSPISDETDGSQARKIRWSKSVAGMLGRRTAGNVNVDDDDVDGTVINMLTVLTLIRSYDAANQRTGRQKLN